MQYLLTFVQRRGLLFVDDLTLQGAKPMSYFSDQYIAACDARTTDDDWYDRKEGIDTRPRLSVSVPAPAAPIISEVFCCQECGADVALVAANQDDLVYQCQSP